jgi:hypothetical protein
LALFLAAGRGYRTLHFSKCGTSLRHSLFDCNSILSATAVEIVCMVLPLEVTGVRAFAQENRDFRPSLILAAGLCQGCRLTTAQRESRAVSCASRTA